MVSSITLSVFTRPYVAFVLLSFLLVSWGGVSAEQNRIVELVREEVDARKVYNFVSNAEWSQDTLSVLADIWAADLPELYKVPRSPADDDIIRLALANVLMQAARHCRVDSVAMGELHDFVLSRTVSDDPRVRGRAIHLLGLAGYESDIPFLVSVVRAEREGYAEEAVLSIAFIHSEAALEALERVLGEVSRPSLRRFIDEMVEKYKRYPAKEYSPECLPP